MMRILAFVAFLVLLSPAYANAAPTYGQLVNRNARLTANIARMRGERDTATRLAATRLLAIGQLRAENDSLRTARDAASATAAATAIQRDQALAGLPEAIGAVPLDVFWSLVVTPAATAWNCGSFYSSGGYVSQEFRSRNWC